LDAAVNAAAHTAAVDHPIAVQRLGNTDYVSTWQAMQAFTAARHPVTVDEMWLTEHAPIYTMGLAGRSQHLKRATAIRLLKVDRGGQITYHGPGQLIAYLMLDLRRRDIGVRDLVRRIERGVIEFLASVGVQAHGRTDAPGVYVSNDGGEAKIAALGLKIRNGCTYHGVALNVDMDLTPFHDIDPCGFPNLAVTQLADLGVSMRGSALERAFADALITSLARSQGAGR